MTLTGSRVPLLLRRFSTAQIASGTASRSEHLAPQVFGRDVVSLARKAIDKPIRRVHWINGIISIPRRRRHLRKRRIACCGAGPNNRRY